MFFESWRGVVGFIFVDSFVYSRMIMTTVSSSAVSVVLSAQNRLDRSDRSQHNRIRIVLCNGSNIGGPADIRTIVDSSNHPHPYESDFMRMPFDQLRTTANSSILLSGIRPHRPTPTQALCELDCISLTFQSVFSYVYSSIQPILLHEPRLIHIFIKSIRDTTISIHIDSTSSISDLKHLIYAHDGILPFYQRLMHRGRELRDDALLSGLDVDGATITCLLRVLGGIPKKLKIPLRWWFGFSRSYEDGETGEERIRHVLSEIEFKGSSPRNWYSDLPLSEWEGIEFYSGIAL